MNNEAILFAYVSEQFNFFHTTFKFDSHTEEISTGHPRQSFIKAAATRYRSTRQQTRTSGNADYGDTAEPDTNRSTLQSVLFL